MSDTTKRLLVIGGLVAALFLAGLLFWGWERGMIGGESWWWGLPFLVGFGFLFMLGFWALIIAVVLLAVRWVGGSGAAPSPESRESALDILGKRYARGEIDKAEFEAKRKDLGA